jgi:hypothetical protein
MDKLKTHATFLCKVGSTKHKGTVKELIKKAKPKQLDVICEIILNTLNGTLPLSKDLFKKAKVYQSILRKLAKKCLKKLLRKKLFIKYFSIIRRIVAAAIPICGIIASVVSV